MVNGHVSYVVIEKMKEQYKINAVLIFAYLVTENTQTKN